MKRQAVNSSQIKSVGYDAASKVLEIEFHPGSVYQYEDVPQDLADSLVRADSVGHFFGQHVKGVFTHRKVQ